MPQDRQSQNFRVLSSQASAEREASRPIGKPVRNAVVRKDYRKFGH
jgi:hypothetical protein